MMKFWRIVPLAVVFVAVLTVAWWFGPNGPDPAARDKVVSQYTDVAHAVFADSLLAAQKLQRATNALAADPSEQTLAAARDAWRAARIPYMQSEVFRFGNPPVDAWEGQVNAWPLDEGLIDYTVQNYVFEQGNTAGQANLIANTELQVGSREVDASEFTPELLADLNEIGGSEANVATGYHAIEFLLWGQDTNGTGEGAGQRPHTDFVTKAETCTDGSAQAPVQRCERRVAYLQAATQLLINDLEYMVSQWAPEEDNNYRAQLLNDTPTEEALRRILFGMGSLALGELAGERMKVALIAHSTEDEHDCFSDNTHNSHYFDTLGIANVYEGDYQRLDGELLAGPGIKDLLAAQNPQAGSEFDAALDKALSRLNDLVQAAESGERFDQMIAPGNEAGNERVQNAIDALVVLAQQIEQASKVLGIENLQPDAAGHEF